MQSGINSAEFRNEVKNVTEIIKIAKGKTIVSLDSTKNVQPNNK